MAAVTDRSNCLLLITLNLYLASSVSLGLACGEAHRHCARRHSHYRDMEPFTLTNR